MKPLRLLLPLFLLLAIAAPVAAEESSPEPAPSVVPVPALYAAPSDPSVTTPCAPEIVDSIAAGTGPGVVAEACLLPDGSVLPINVMTISEPMPISLGFEDCAAELATEVANGGTPIAPAPCFLPDGTLYELAARGTMPNERGDSEVDYETLYADWLETFKAGLSACPEGADPADPALMTCLLPDGSIAGPMPLFAPAPEAADGEITEAVTNEEERGSTDGAALYALFAGLGVALLALYLIRRKGSAAA